MPPDTDDPPTSDVEEANEILESIFIGSNWQLTSEEEQEQRELAENIHTFIGQ